MAKLEQSRWIASRLLHACSRDEMCSFVLRQFLPVLAFTVVVPALVVDDCRRSVL
jgi:hypothetical protein